ncbi:MAG: hypothetical protein ABIN89_22730 [Chitinophagaceae bacterium]
MNIKSMKAATIHDIKEELSNLPSTKVLELCLRLAKYKKENKELLSYLLFESHDEQAFIETAKKEIEDSFDEISGLSLYHVKKSLRKILRTISKYSRHTGTKQSELELLIHFCKEVKKTGIPYKKNTALKNIYERQIYKISNLVLLLHEDLQYDYKKEMEKL